MNRDDHTELFTAEPAETTEPRGDEPDLLVALDRIQNTLDELRRLQAASVREHRHREFSPARLFGSILQALVFGLMLWALSDWVFAAAREPLFVKLGFALVLQLGALTAFILGREVE